MQDNVISVFNHEFNHSEDYTVEYLLSCSVIDGRDIIKANKNLTFDDGDIIAIAVVAGDDIVCMNVKTKEVLLYLIETGDMKYLHIADDFAEFCKMIKF